VRLIATIVHVHIDRLQARLAEHEERAQVEASELADRAAFDAGSSFERLRRYQSARGRELLRTIDLVMKMQKAEFGVERTDDEDEPAECPPEAVFEATVPPPAEAPVNVDSEAAESQGDDAPASPAVPAGIESTDGKSDGDPARKSKPQPLGSRQKRQNEANATKSQDQIWQEITTQIEAIMSMERSQSEACSPPSGTCSCDSVAGGGPEGSPGAEGPASGASFRSTPPQPPGT
jgi:hypothetical protein